MGHKWICTKKKPTLCMCMNAHAHAVSVRQRPSAACSRNRASQRTSATGCRPRTIGHRCLRRLLSCSLPRMARRRPRGKRSSLSNSPLRCTGGYRPPSHCPKTQSWLLEATLVCDVGGYKGAHEYRLVRELTEGGVWDGASRDPGTPDGRRLIGRACMVFRRGRLGHVLWWYVEPYFY